MENPCDKCKRRGTCTSRCFPKKDYDRGIMIEMLEILQELAEKAAKDLPEDVVADLKELSRLQADVHICLMENKIIDTGKIKRINELVREHFYHEEQQKKQNDPVETFDFGEAIRRLKKGAHLARKGWNGKEQYILLGRNFSYQYDDGAKTKGNIAFHRDIGSRAVVFVGTRGAQVGWLASQADMLADD